MSSDQHSEGGEGDQVLVAEFALGLLDADEHEQMARRLAEHPLLRRDLGLWRRRLAALDIEFAETAPPPDLLQRIEARLFPAAPAGEGGFWGSLALWRGLAAACLVIAAIAGGLNFIPRPLPTGQELVAALEAQGSNVKFVAFYDTAAGTVRLAALSGAAVPDKDFELWAIKGKNAPIAMGVIPVNARSDIPLSASLKDALGEGTVLAVTLEQKGGSPTGLPQGPIVAAGAATAI